MGIFSGLFKSRDKPQNRTAGSNYAFFMGGTTSGKTVTERSAMQMTAVYTDLQEAFGIDEPWLDVTASAGIKGDGRKIAEEIRQRVKRELGITVSIGVSWNKIFAKFGSDYKKPDAVTEINRDNYAVNVSASGTHTLNTIPRASSVSAASVNMGRATTISISRASSSFIHTLTYSFGIVSC